MRVLELFSGTQSISKAFRARGHKTLTVDYDPIFSEDGNEYGIKTDLTMDVMDLTKEMIIEYLGGEPDVIWDSMDCTTYSVAAIYHHRNKEDDGNLAPKSEKAKNADKVAQRALEIISWFPNAIYFIENPRGAMRKMGWMQDYPRYTISYCLAKESRVLTKNGTFPIGGLAGTVQTLLTKDGKWVDAPIRCYGVQPLQKITLSRAKRKKVIYATAEHKWFVGNKTKDTQSLRQGDRLEYCHTTKLNNLKINNEYVARGFVFGDGWSLDSKDFGFVMFCNEKEEMLKYFEGIGGKTWRDDTETCSIVKKYGFPKTWKTSMPLLSDNPSDIYSWIAGYIAADGYVHKSTGQVSISSSKKEDLDYFRDLCTAIGIGTYSIVEYWRKGFGKKDTPLYQVTLMKSDVDVGMILREKHKEAFIKSGKPRHQARRWSVVSVEPSDRVEPVYCAEVEDTHAFVLEDGILTHNCQYGDDRMKPTDIWTNHPEPNFRPMCKPGADCHTSAPRGSITGVQGQKNAIERSRIPEDFCKHIVDICEQAV